MTARTEHATPRFPQTPDARPRRSVQRRRQHRRHQRLTAAYVAALVLLGSAVPVLGWIGVRTILDSSDGEVVDPQLDPDEPGYQALVSPSPTLLVLQVDEAGDLAGTVLLGLASEEGSGGGVLVLPPGLVGEAPEIGALAIEAAFGFSGIDAAHATAEWALGLAIDDVVVLDAAEWSELLSSTGPLEITNPDEIRSPSGEVTFPAGDLVLEPGEVPHFAAALEAGESRLNRLYRQEVVWRSWLAAMADDPSGLRFPGEEGRGLARFLPSIVSGPVHLEVLPVEPLPDGPPDQELFITDATALARITPEVVPFPASDAGGSRPFVRILSGVGPGEGTSEVARRVVAAGGQVVVVGNADRFDYEETVITYWDDARRPVAEAVAEALGVGSVTRVDEVDEGADILVVIGRDLQRSLGT